MPTFSARRWTPEGLVPSVFAGSLLAACGGALPVSDVNATTSALEICVDENGLVVAGGTCGEDHQCRDAGGFVIEGTMCIEEPTNMCMMDTEAPVITVNGATRTERRRHGGVKVTLADCGVNIVDRCDGTLDLDSAQANIECVSFDSHRRHHTDDGSDDQAANVWWGHGAPSCGDKFKVLDAQTVLLKKVGDYTITFTVKDAAGNAAAASCKVSVSKHGCRQRTIVTSPTADTCN